MISRRTRSLTLSILLLSVFFQVSYVYAASYSSKALIENSRLLDGKKITYRGEAMTAIMRRGTHAWVNVSDGDNAIGVWCKVSMLEQVKFLGDYKHSGDILQVDGIFNRACDMHGGQPDIHASKVKTIKDGYLFKESVNLGKTGLAILLFLLTLAVTIAFRKRI